MSGRLPAQAVSKRALHSSAVETGLREKPTTASARLSSHQYLQPVPWMRKVRGGFLQKSWSAVIRRSERRWNANAWGSPRLADTLWTALDKDPPADRAEGRNPLESVVAAGLTGTAEVGPEDSFVDSPKRHAPARFANVSEAISRHRSAADRRPSAMAEL